MCRQQLARHVLCGCLYATRVFMRAVVTSGVIALAYSMVVAYLLNLGGEAMVSRPRGEGRSAGQSPLLPEHWTSSDVDALDDGPYYAFLAVRMFILGLSAMSVVITLLVLWRGLAATLRGPMILAGISMMIIAGSTFARQWLCSEGYLASRQHIAGLKLSTYGISILLGWLTLLAGVPRGERLQHAGRCFVLWLIIPTIHATLGEVCQAYFRATGFWIRFGCIVVVSVIRSVAMHMAFWATSRFTDCPPDASTVVPWTASMLTLGSIHIMQMSTQDMVETLLLFSWLAISEAVRHVVCILYGKSELGVCIAAVKCIACRFRAQKKMTAVFPDLADTSSDEKTARGSDESHSGCPAADPAPTTEQLESQRKFVILVESVNHADVVVILTVTGIFLVGKINPLEGASDPWPHAKTITTGFLALLFEFVADVVVAVIIAAKRAPEAFSLDDAADANSGLSWMVGCRSMLAILVTIETVLNVTIRLCPRPTYGAHELHVIGHCTG